MDACLSCPDFPATVPHEVTEEPGHPGSLFALYRCPRGHVWPCWWDAEAAEWPAPRRNAA